MLFARSNQNPQPASIADISEGYALELRGVSKSFGAMQAVADVNIDLQRGEILCLLGPSGCGKTTTLRLIAGFDTPDSGVVRIGDRTVYGGGANESPERRRIGMVFQEGALFPHLTVEQNIAFGLPRGHQRKQQVAESLRTVGLEGYGERYPHELSGGQQQRVALARALAPEPDLILMDEPFSSLDPGLRDQLRQDVAAILRARNATVVCVTHDQEEAMQLGDRVAVMQDGRIEQLGSPEEVFHHPDTQFAAEFLGTADFLPAWRDAEYLASEVGRVPWPASCPTGQQLQVMIRPDCVDIHPDDAGAGVVLQREFRGAFHLYTVGLPSGHRVRVLKSHLVHLDPGTRVGLSMRQGHTMQPFVDGMAQG